MSQSSEYSLMAVMADMLQMKLGYASSGVIAPSAIEVALSLGDGESIKIPYEVVDGDVSTTDGTVLVIGRLGNIPFMAGYLQTKEVMFLALLRESDIALKFELHGDQLVNEVCDLLDAMHKMWVAEGAPGTEGYTWEPVDEVGLLGYLA